LSGARGGNSDIDSDIATVREHAYRPPDRGIAYSAAGTGEWATATSSAPESGLGGIGLNDVFTASLLLNPGLVGGGGGAASSDGTSESTGGNGGGAFIVLARGTITNAGVIN